MQDDPDLNGALLPGQLASATHKPLPRRALGRGTVALLVALRIYVLVAIPIVGYALVRAILATHH